MNLYILEERKNQTGCAEKLGLTIIRAVDPAAAEKKIRRLYKKSGYEVKTECQHPDGWAFSLVMHNSDRFTVDGWLPNRPATIL